ncbi:MAG: hypothetical protein EPN45_16550 [Rhizobiaceae bacterium]|nr:MAG: hypothetical protein EPN45_16550 [Rhizobiaceae bacterium]
MHSEVPCLLSVAAWAACLVADCLITVAHRDDLILDFATYVLIFLDLLSIGRPVFLDEAIKHQACLFEGATKVQYFGIPDAEDLQAASQCGHFQHELQQALLIIVRFR